MLVSRIRQELDFIDYIKKLEKRVRVLETVNRSANTSVDSGSFNLSGGSLTVTDTFGNVVFELKRENDKSVIYMNPTFGNPNDEQLKITASSTVDDGPEFRVEVQDSTGTSLGGYLSVSRDKVALSQFADGGIESGLSFSPAADRPRAIILKGRFWPNETIDANQATFVGKVDVPAGFSSVTVSYDRTITDNMIPIVTVSSATAVAWVVSSQTSTDFTVTWADTTAKTVNYWCFATPLGA